MFNIFRLLVFALIGFVIAFIVQGVITIFTSISFVSILIACIILVVFIKPLTEFEEKLESIINLKLNKK